MNVRALLTAFRLPHLRARWQLLRDVAPFLRLQFLSFASESGLLQALRSPASRDDLIERLQVQRPDLLEVALDLGVALKELSRRDGRYAVQGGRSRALLHADGDPLAAMIQELLTYHGPVYQHLAGRLRGAPLGEYLEDTGTLIARSSRVVEPFIANFVRAVVGADRPVRLLEIGCGSGVYLRYAAEANARVTGVAIDLQESVVEQARANVQSWGISDRFAVVVGDIRHPPADVSGPFDLITLHQNVYYFAPEERPDLFQRLRLWLAPQGVLALTSIIRGKTLAALDFDLALRSTLGCAALLELKELIAQLEESGFSQVRATRLMPLEPLYGVTASP